MFSGSGLRDLPSVPVVRRNFREGKYVSNLSEDDQREIGNSDVPEFNKVRKKLAFNLDEEEDRMLDNTFDFTDKMAAFRNIIKPKIKNHPKENEQHKQDTIKMGNFRAKISKLADKELAKMSMMNYQAHVHLLSTNQSESKGKSLKSSKVETEKFSKKKEISAPALKPQRRGSVGSFSKMEEQKRNNIVPETRARSSSVGGRDVVRKSQVKRSASPSPVVASERGRDQKNKKKCPNFSEGFHKDGKEAIDKLFIPIQNGVDSAYVKKQLGSKSSPNGPLSDRGSLENTSASHASIKRVKTIQSNVPHYHPKWSTIDSEAVDATGAHDDIQDVLNLIDGASQKSPVQTNVIDYLGSPQSEQRKSSKKVTKKVVERDSSEKYERENKDGEDRMKERRRESSARVGSVNSGHSTNSRRSRSRSEIRSSRHQEDTNVSDSSKENVPKLNMKIDLSEYMDTDEDVKVIQKEQEGFSSKKKSKLLKRGGNESTKGKESQKDIMSFKLTSRSDSVSRTPKAKEKLELPEEDFRGSSNSLETLRSNVSQSSVLYAATLLKRFYKADPEKREQIFLKARYFRRWKKFVWKQRPKELCGTPRQRKVVNGTIHVVKKEDSAPKTDSNHVGYVMKELKPQDVLSNDSMEYVKYPQMAAATESLLDTVENENFATTNGRKSGLDNERSSLKKKLVPKLEIPSDSTQCSMLDTENKEKNESRLNGADKTLGILELNDLLGNGQNFTGTMWKRKCSSVSKVSSINRINSIDSEEVRRDRIEDFLEDALQHLPDALKNKPSKDFDSTDSHYCHLSNKQISKNGKVLNQHKKVSSSKKSKHASSLKHFGMAPVNTLGKKTQELEIGNRDQISKNIEELEDLILEQINSNVQVPSLPTKKKRSSVSTDVQRSIKPLGKKADSVASLPVKHLIVADSETQLLETASYGVSLQRSEIFLRLRLIKNYFTLWRTRAVIKAKHSKADALLRRHSLRKGLKAFRWAITRSRIQVEIFQAKVTRMTLQFDFQKWYRKTLQNRQHRLQLAFDRWRTYTVESKKIHRLRQQRERKEIRRAMFSWKMQFQNKLKENKANKHFTHVLLEKKLTNWIVYAQEAKNKKLRNLTAKQHYKKSLQNKMYQAMVETYHKVLRAKNHFRLRLAGGVFQVWHKAAQVCKIERQRDMSKSREHRRMTVSRTFFCTWHEQLLVQRAKKLADIKAKGTMFKTWKKRWEDAVAYRQMVEAQHRRDILYTSLHMWHNIVLLLQKKRQMAVVYIQRVHIRQLLLDWHDFTVYRQHQRSLLRMQTSEKNHKLQQKCFGMWRNKFEDCLDIQKAKTFWSNTCVRKCIARWRLTCHKRALKRMLIETEPLRNLTKQKVAFKKWMQACSKVEEEKHEAEIICSHLQRSKLERCYGIWWIATQQRLIIRPMLQRKQRIILTRSFDAWRGLIVHKRQCRRSEELLRITQLRTQFGHWRRQFLVHQLEKEIRQKTLMNLQRNCLQGWRLVITQKHQVRDTYNKALTRRMFYDWKARAFLQIRTKMEDQETREYHTSLLECHFHLWRENARHQRVTRESAFNEYNQRKHAEKLVKCFGFWRRLMRANIVARENQNQMSRRFLLQIMREWQVVTCQRMRESVNHFAMSIGLSPPYEMLEMTASTTSTGNVSDMSHGLELTREWMEETTEILAGYSSPQTSLTTQTPRSIGTPLRRMFSSASLDLDIEWRPSLADSTILDAKFEMEQAVKTETLRGLVVTAVKRIRFWPLSMAFDQWREFTIRERNLKEQEARLIEFSKGARLRWVFYHWRSSQRDALKIKQFRNTHCMARVFTALYEHRCQGQYKKRLATIAVNHISLKMFRKIFPVWYQKAQEKRHKENVMHLWSHVTPEEQKLAPMERQLRAKLQKRSLQQCYAIWSLKFLQVYKLRKAFNRVLLTRFFGVWREWAHEKHTRETISESFNKQRLQSQMFKKWCCRCDQVREVEERYKDFWNQYLSDMLQAWHMQAKVAKQQRVQKSIIEKKVCKNSLGMFFTKWKEETHKLLLVTQQHNMKLCRMVFVEWYHVTKLQLTRKKQVLEFRVCSYTSLVSRMFQTWRKHYILCLHSHLEHEKRVRMQALELGKIWKKKARKARGRQLQQYFASRKVRMAFAKWKEGYERIIEYEHQLQFYLTQRKQNILKNYLLSWQLALRCQQAVLVYNNKIQTSVFKSWLLFTKAQKQRQKNLQLFHHIQKQRMTAAYYLYWVHITKVRQSIQDHFSLKLEIRVLRGWCLYTRTQRRLRQQEAIMSRKVNNRVIFNAWHKMREQYDYCHSLGDIANKLVHDKNQACMKAAMFIWRDRLSRVLAGQCYQHLLARRVARLWRRFVYRKKEERLHELQQMNRAVQHRNRKLCAIAMEAWKDEIRIVHMIQRHKNRLAAKYGHVWKLRVDMVFTAKLMEEERLYRKCWMLWRQQFVQIATMKKVENSNTRQLVTQVFVAWRNLYLQQRSVRMVSSIPTLHSISSQPSSAGSTPRFSDHPHQPGMASSVSLANDSLPSPRPSLLPMPRSARGSSGIPQRLKERRPSLPNNGVQPQDKF